MKTHKFMMTLKHGLSFLALAGILLLSACAELELASHAAKQMQDVPDDAAQGAYKVGKPYQVAGVWYYPKVEYDYAETGIASWYGPGFHGNLTANGEIYDENALTAAHRTLPMPSQVRVTNLENGRSIVVRINDRGPFKHGRIIDMSRRGAQLLGFERSGTAKVRVEILEEESRRLAAILQSEADAQYAPLAAPVEPVLSTPLGSAENGAVGDSASDTVATEVKPEPIFYGDSLPDDAAVESEALETVDTVPLDAPTQTAALPLEEPEPVVSESSESELKAEEPTVQTPSATWRVAPVATPDGTVSQAAIEDTAIYIQAGSFLERGNAERLSQRVSVLGPSSVTPAFVGDRMFYRVRVGPMDSIDQADHVLQVLLKNGIDGAQVVVD